MTTREIVEQVKEELQIEDLRSQIAQLRESRESQGVEGGQGSRGGLANQNQMNRENNMDILIDDHMRDITQVKDPQPSGGRGGLASNNRHFKDLSNHELHQVKKMHEKDHQSKPRTILDEPLGEIMNKLVNFLTFSFDGYEKAIYKAEIMEDVYDDKSTYETIKIHLIAITLFMSDDENILYIGILLIFFSMMLYLVNITTS